MKDSDPTYVVQGRKFKLKRPPKLTDTQKLRLKRSRYWAITAFEDARARWSSPDVLNFADRAPAGYRGPNSTIDAEQSRSEAKIEVQRALRNAPGLYFLEAAE